MAGPKRAIHCLSRAEGDPVGTRHPRPLLWCLARSTQPRLSSEFKVKSLADAFLDIKHYLHVSSSYFLLSNRLFCRMIGKWRAAVLRLLFFILICLSVGWLGGLATRSSITTWYAGLQKPPLNPPDWIFAPVWTALYLLIAFVGWRIWSFDHPHKNILRLLFIVQFLLNAIWSFLFFKLQSPLAAFIDILLLWICTLMLTKNLWQIDKQTCLLFIPYLFWLTFAVYLNTTILWLNR